MAQLVVVLTIYYRSIDYNTRQMQMLHGAVRLRVQNSCCVVAHDAESPRLPVGNGKFTLGYICNFRRAPDRLIVGRLIS